MSAKIFLVGEKKKLISMVETSFGREVDLQELLSDYTDLLPGDQIDPDNQRRWLLVTREMAIPSSEEEKGRWSLDHLFLDQDGIPTFVECKRASDTRNRREVVAQMLDYAANGTKYWSADTIRQVATNTSNNSGKLIEDEILSLIASGTITGIDEFWNQVQKNLISGKIRLIFVADEIPRELRRLAEFLNEKLNDVVVLAVEVKQFTSEGHKAIVPRVIGMTETARDVKGRSSSITTREEFLSECPPQIAEFFDHLLDAVELQGYSVYWGTKSFSVRAHVPGVEGFASILYGYPPNFYDVYFGHLTLPDKILSTLRKDLLKFGIFRETPKTLRALLDVSNLEEAQKSYCFMFDWVENLIKVSKGKATT